MPSFFYELKRRNVYKVAVGYGVVGWLIIEVATAIFPVLGISNELAKLIIVIVVLGFPAALIVAWLFEMTPQGMKRTQNISPNEHIPYWSRRKFAVVITSMALMAAALLAFQLWRAHTPAPAVAPSAHGLP